MSSAIYVVNYKDDERRNRMTQRVKHIGLDAHFVEPVSTEDPRIQEQPITDFEKRNWSIFFQHVDCMRDFYEKTTFDYCIVCEDDVVLSRTLKDEIPMAIQMYKDSQLDMLLLSYLWPFDMIENGWFPIRNRCTFGSTEYKIHAYPEDLWGAHMYMFSREHAKRMIDRYTAEYALAETQAERPFCTDWQFTKFGSRGLITPMLGLEEGEVKTDHQGQIDFHRSVFNFHYREDKYI
jgi:GR25 family glycosyltransferase involved in LPS biosynthesis